MDRSEHSSNSSRQNSDHTVDLEKRESLAQVQLPHSDMDVEKGVDPIQKITDSSDDEFVLPDKRSKAKRTANYPFFSTHRRLILIMTLINFGLLGLALGLEWWDNLPAIGYIIIGNFTFGIMIRQQRVINFLFKFATLTGTRLPLPIRWMLGKVFHFGGLHSGCTVAATIWLLLFTISATYLAATDHPDRPSAGLLSVTYIILVFLILMVIFALPTMRSRFHNSFEATHRFMGWTVLGLVWAHTVLLVDNYKAEDETLRHAFFSSVTPYLLFLVTASIIHPWVYLRKVPVTISKPSNHVIIVKFDNVRQAFPGSSSSISVNPLFEWHAFANIVTPGRTGFRLVISRAGDWTSRMIDNPPTHFWMRGIATAGVANIETLFHRVLYVATGSGIGPVLPHLLANEVPSRLFWSTRTPRETYGDELVDEILEASPDAVVHDTTLYGKPDMVATSYRMAKEFGAEAVIIISNQKLTRKVVYGMESRGIPAYGAIWDS